MAPGRPAPAAPRRTGAGGLCRAFAPARGAVWALADACRLEGPAVRENSSDRCHGAVPEAQAARRLPMVWAMAGIGVCMAADGGAVVTSGTLMELLSGRGACPV